MENEQKIPMQFQSRECGTTTLQKEGLYVRVECVCDMVTDRVVRAYLEGKGGTACLGVLVPENGKLRLRRKIPTSHFLPGEYSTVIVSEQPVDGWKPWEGLLDGQPLLGALSRLEHGKRMVAIPFTPGEPFDHAGRFRQSEPLEIQGQLYLVTQVEEVTPSLESVETMLPLSEEAMG